MTLSAALAAIVMTLVLAWPFQAARPAAEREASMDNTITVKVGDRAFVATLADTPTAAAFRELLPLSVTMTELNGNEKYARLSVSLPIRPSTPAGIRTGDLMMYGATTVVLFYKSFPTTYSYTRLGRIDDPEGLDAALGTGAVDVTFELRGPERK
jgi:hypothetical protein